MNNIGTKKLDNLMWGCLVVLVVLPWMIFFLRPQPSDVLEEVREFRQELAESRQDLEMEILRRTRDRIYRSQINELIETNNLKTPPTWDE